MVLLNVIKPNVVIGSNCWFYVDGGRCTCINQSINDWAGMTQINFITIFVFSRCNWCIYDTDVCEETTLYKLMSERLFVGSRRRARLSDNPISPSPPSPRPQPTRMKLVSGTRPEEICFTSNVQCQVRIQGGPGGPGPPLTLGFEAPKLSIFGPYLIFP